MAKQLTELPEHTRFGFQIREPQGYEHQVMYKPDPVCGCGCGKAVVDGFKYDDEYFQTEACVVRMMLNEGWLKRVG